MKCLLQERTSQTQTNQNNYSVKTLSLIIFAEEFETIRFNSFNLIIDYQTSCCECLLAKYYLTTYLTALEFEIF